jgi:hypothetical protein
VQRLPYEGTASSTAEFSSRWHSVMYPGTPAHPPTEDFWRATNPITSALSSPMPAKWRPLSPLRAPGHSPRSAAAASRGTTGPPCPRLVKQRTLGLKLGSQRLSEVPLLHCHLRAAPGSEPCLVRAERGSNRSWHSVPPRSRWGPGGGGGGEGEGGGGGGGGSGQV